MLFTLIGYVFLGSSACAAGTNKSGFIGSWQLISGEYVNEKGELIHYDKAKMKAIKTLSEHYYNFTSVSGERFWAAGAGQYKFSDNTYTELPLYTSYKIAKGEVYQFSYKLEGDYWYKSRYKKGIRVEYEVWKKL